ncbi:hypothetical protein OF83DRAFT_1191042 [Amylostereum chailletii]|nr:hypothetical protein OF83DRAFT_1191042 [Amylostereum chailletii]
MTSSFAFTTPPSFPSQGLSTWSIHTPPATPQPQPSPTSFTGHLGTPSVAGAVHTAASASPIPPAPGMSDADIVRVKAWCDAVAAKHGLIPAQYGNLHTMIELGRTLDVNDLRLRLIAQVTNYQIINKIDKQETDYQKFQKILEDLCKRLTDKFDLNKDQHDELIRLSKDMAFQPTRVSRHAIALDLEAHIKKNAIQLGFDNVFGNSKREKALRKACSTRAGNACTQFHYGLLDSMDTDPCNLEKATYELASKLKAGGALNIKLPHQLMVAVLTLGSKRRFVWENLATLTPLDDEVDSDDDAGGTPPPAKKQRRKGGAVGKVHKGEDFWGRVDAHMKQKTDEYGVDLTSEKWRSYIQETITMDIAKFGHGNGALIESLPVVFLTHWQSPSAPSEASSSTPAVGTTTWASTVGIEPSQGSQGVTAAVSHPSPPRVGVKDGPYHVTSGSGYSTHVCEKWDQAIQTSRLYEG